MGGEAQVRGVTLTGKMEMRLKRGGHCDKMLKICLYLSAMFAACALGMRMSVCRIMVPRGLW